MLLILFFRVRWAKDLSMTLPEMVFGDSKLEIWNESLGVRFEYNAFDALSQCNHESDIKVSMAQTWKAKAGVEVPEGHIFDWTYGTKYRGTLVSNLSDSTRVIGPDATDERIDFELLKVCLLICNRPLSLAALSYIHTHTSEIA
jgi:hypothetical protein